MSDEKKSVLHDPVNRPAHYVQGGMEAIDVIEAFDLGFKAGNAVKYILRAGKKGDRLEDLRKAAWYIDREIRAEEAERAQKRAATLSTPPGGFVGLSSAAALREQEARMERTMARAWRQAEGLIFGSSCNTPGCIACARGLGCR